MTVLYNVVTSQAKKSKHAWKIWRNPGYCYVQKLVVLYRTMYNLLIYYRVSVCVCVCLSMHVCVCVSLHVCVCVYVPVCCYLLNI